MAEALSLNIVESVTSAEHLKDAALSLAAQIAQGASPLGFAAVKKILNEGPSLPFAEAVLLDQAQRRPLESTRDYAEGMSAQAEKRKPRFEGR